MLLLVRCEPKALGRPRIFPLQCDSALALLCLADSLVPRLRGTVLDGSPDLRCAQCTPRAVSPLLAKDAAGTPEVPAPVVHEGGKAMLSHSLLANIKKEQPLSHTEHSNLSGLGGIRPGGNPPSREGRSRDGPPPSREGCYRAARSPGPRLARGGVVRPPTD